MGHFLYTLVVKDKSDDLYNEYFSRFSDVLTKAQGYIPAEYAAHVFGVLTLIVVVLLGGPRLRGRSSRRCRAARRRCSWTCAATSASRSCRRRRPCTRSTLPRLSMLSRSSAACRRS